MRTIGFLNILIILCFVYSGCGGESKVENNKDEIESERLITAQKQAVSMQSENDRIIVELNKQLESDPGNASILAELGDRYLQLRNSEKARENFTKASEIDATNVKFKIGIANSYGDQGNVEDAEKIFSELLSADENNTDVLLSWGVLYYNNGIRNHDRSMLEVAKAKFDRVVEIDGENLKGHFNLGLLYILDEDSEKALEEFDRVYQIDPDHESAMYHASRLALQLEKWDKCREYALNGLALDNDATFYYYLGKVAYADKDYKTAKEYLEKYVAKGDDHWLLADSRATLLELDRDSEK